jgi:hypothetical protein
MAAARSMLRIPSPADCGFMAAAEAYPPRGLGSKPQNRPLRPRNGWPLLPACRGRLRVLAGGRRGRVLDGPPGTGHEEPAGDAESPLGVSERREKAMIPAKNELPHVDDADQESPFSFRIFFRKIEQNTRFSAHPTRSRPLFGCCRGFQLTKGRSHCPSLFSRSAGSGDVWAL